MDQGEITRAYDGALGGAHKGDVIPMFRKEAVHNEYKSAEQGRPIFDMIDMIQIVIPGDPKTSVVRLVKEEDKIRFAEAYAQFKAGQEMALEGTPVDVWPRLTIAEVHQLKRAGFYTVEHVADCADSNLGRLGIGGLQLRELARGFLEAAKNGGNAERLVMENSQLRSQLTSALQSIQDLTAKFEAFARKSGADVGQIDVDTALSHTRDAVATKMPALPDGWQEFGVKKLIELCGDKGFAVTPRNKEEAFSLLNEYEAKRNATRAN